MSIHIEINLLGYILFGLISVSMAVIAGSLAVMAYEARRFGFGGYINLSTDDREN